jgi:hypothetical protein
MDLPLWRQLKQLGIFWSQRGGEDILSLVLGPHFDAAWSSQTSILARQCKKLASGRATGFPVLHPNSDRGKNFSRHFAAEFV